MIALQLCQHTMRELISAWLLCYCVTGGQHTSIRQAAKVKLEAALRAKGVPYQFGQPLKLFNSNELQIQLTNDVIAKSIIILPGWK